MFDAIIIGGGTAGLSAALVLGRSRRHVLVCDMGQPRNTSSSAVHSFFSRDGISPTQLRSIGHEQLRPYTTVEVRSGEVTNVAPLTHHFHVTLADGTQEYTRMLLLATGVRDELPTTPGFAEFWGRGVFHCPYCHGWEVRDQPLAVYGNGEQGVELALLLTNWSRDLVFCTDGPAQVSEQDRLLLATNGIALREEPIARLEGSGGDFSGPFEETYDALERIVFVNEEILLRRGLFLHPKQQQRSHLPKHLGCTMTDMGVVSVDEFGWTGIAGLYVAGDAAHVLQQVAFAAAEGARAAVAINRSLLQQDVDWRNNQ